MSLAQVIAIDRPPPGVVVLQGGKKAPNDGLKRQEATRFTLIEIHESQPQHVCLKWENLNLASYWGGKPNEMQLPKHEKGLSVFRRSIPPHAEFVAAYRKVLAFYVTQFNRHFELDDTAIQLALLSEADFQEANHQFGGFTLDDFEGAPGALRLENCDLARLRLRWRPEYNAYGYPCRFAYTFQMDGNNGFDGFEQSFVNAGWFQEAELDLTPLFREAQVYMDACLAREDARQTKLFELLAKTDPEENTDGNAPGE
jgi:hypothetical protein